MRTKLLVTLLTTSNLEALSRLVYVITNEMLEAPTIDADFVIVVNTLDESYWDKVLKQNYPLEVIRTWSDGSPGCGKNSCYRLLEERHHDFLSQIDGDDILYPTYLLSLEEHLRRSPSLDVLGFKTLDYVTKEGMPDCGHTFTVGDSWYGTVWGVSLVKRCYKEYGGCGEHQNLWTDIGDTPSQDRLLLNSRRSVAIKMTEHLLCGEDHLQSFKFLGEHQKGNLRYYQSMSSDVYCMDWHSPNSTQKKYKDYDYLSALREEVPKYVRKERSSFEELPTLYIDLLLNQFDKAIWLNKVWERFYTEK